MVDRFKRLAPEALIDLVPLLAKREPALKLVCFHGTGLPRDVWHATRLRDLRSTITIALSLKMHNVLGPLVKNGIFEAFMQPLADGSSIEDSVADVRSRL